MPMLSNYKVTRAFASEEDGSDESDLLSINEGETDEEDDNVEEAKRKGKGKKIDVADTSAAVIQANAFIASNTGPERDGRRSQRPSNFFLKEEYVTKSYNEKVGEAIGDAFDEWFKKHRCITIVAKKGTTSKGIGREEDASAKLMLASGNSFVA